MNPYSIGLLTCRLSIVLIGPPGDFFFSIVFKMTNQQNNQAANTQGVMAAIANLQESSDLIEVSKLINRMFNAYVGTQDFELLGSSGRMSDTFVYLRLQEFLKSIEESTKTPNLQISKEREAA